MNSASFPCCGKNCAAKRSTRKEHPATATRMRIFPAVKREEYYADLELPLSGDEFIATQQKEMKAALTMLDKGMPKNQKVAITKKKRQALDQGHAP